jgi:hypothetical protein
MHIRKATYYLICALAIGCEATVRTDPGQHGNDEPLVGYSGLLRKLFDDEFGAVALGTTWNDSLAEQNSLLAKRILGANSILRCTVGTVTEGSIDKTMATSLEFRNPGVSLLDGKPRQCEKMSITSSSYSYSILRQSGTSLVGKSVVVFLRDFYDNGGPNRHWHIEPDRPEIRDLVGRLRGPTRQ